MSDLERIRELALRESTQKDNEHNQKEDEARRLAKVHLPLWVKSIERAMSERGYAFERGCTFKYFDYSRSSGGWFSSASVYWIGDSKGPSIDLNELFRLPIDTYTREVTALLGVPFSVRHSVWEIEQSGNDEYDEYRTKYWIETHRSFIIKWG